MAVKKTRAIPNVKTGNANTGKTAKKVSSGSGAAAGAAEGAHYSKTRRQTQREPGAK